MTEPEQPTPTPPVDPPAPADEPTEDHVPHEEIIAAEQITAASEQLSAQYYDDLLPTDTIPTPKTPGPPRMNDQQVIASGNAPGLTTPDTDQETATALAAALRENAELTERVALLTLELDVAKSQIRRNVRAGTDHILVDVDRTPAGALTVQLRIPK